MKQECPVELRFSDAVTQEMLHCWVTVSTPDGRVMADWQVHPELPGIPCDGRVTLSLPAGAYRVTARRWISHEWVEQSIRVPAPEGYDFQLQPRLSPQSRGSYCLDGHNHLNAPTSLPEILLFCAALEIDVVELCQSWTFDPKSHPVITAEAIAAALQEHSTTETMLDFGVERPKKRFGHWWWTGLPPAGLPFVEYESWHDAAFCEWIARQPQPASDVEEQCAFEGELPFESVRRMRRTGGAAVAAHPSSWWWEGPDRTRSFVSNLALDAIYCLLAGEGPDGLVVMGYDADHIFYQNFWFRLLNEGYAITGCAETDAGLCGRHYLGHLRQYLRLESRDRSPRAEAVREGHVLMTSGPWIEFSADGGRHQPGDHVVLGESVHTLDLEIWSDADPDEFIGCIVVYRNGRPHFVESFRDKRPRHLERQYRLENAAEREWYVVKVYGANHPREPEFLDVMAYAELCERKPHEEYKAFRKVAITNPIYFEPPGWSPPAPVVCETILELIDASTGSPLPGVSVHVTGTGNSEVLTTDENGRAQLQLSPLANLQLTKIGYRERRLSIFRDYPPVRRCLEYGYTGQWLFDRPNALTPGQAPWRAFGYEALRAALSRIEWVVELEPEA